MQTVFVQDKPKPEPYREDTPIREALAERPGKPVKIRIQPAIWRLVGDTRGQYRAWREVSWMIECENAEEALALRDVMRAFFLKLGEEGPHAIEARLNAKEDAA
jgi:hypothetical protein